MKRLLIISIVLLSSCELIIDANVPNPGQKMVVNAVQHPDSVWYVNLSGSKYILDPWYSFDPINSADVVIHKPDGSTEKLVEKPGLGIYEGSTRPVPGSTYKLTVSRANYESVEGEMKMPSVVKMIDLEWDSARADNGSVPFKITFDDPAGEANYYSVDVYMYVIRSFNRYPDGMLVIDTTRNLVPTYLRDLGVGSDEQSEFTDKTFDGKTVTIPFVADFVLWGGGRYYKSEVWFTNTPEEFYKYITTTRLQSDVEGDPFAQPVQVFSNMSNSFGIFSGVAPDIRTFKSQEQP